MNNILVKVIDQSKAIIYFIFRDNNGTILNSSDFRYHSNDKRLHVLNAADDSLYFTINISSNYTMAPPGSNYSISFTINASTYFNHSILFIRNHTYKLKIADTTMWKDTTYGNFIDLSFLDDFSFTIDDFDMPGIILDEVNILSKNFGFSDNKADPSRSSLPYLTSYDPDYIWIEFHFKLDPPYNPSKAAIPGWHHLNFSSSKNTCSSPSIEFIDTADNSIALSIASDVFDSEAQAYASGSGQLNYMTVTGLITHNNKLLPGHTYKIKYNCSAAWVSHSHPANGSTASTLNFPTDWEFLQTYTFTMPGVAVPKARLVIYNKSNHTYGEICNTGVNCSSSCTKYGYAAYDTTYPNLVSYFGISEYYYYSTYKKWYTNYYISEVSIVFDMDIKFKTDVPSKFLVYNISDPSDNFEFDVQNNKNFDGNDISFDSNSLFTQIYPLFCTKRSEATIYEFYNGGYNAHIPLVFNLPYITNKYVSDGDIISYSYYDIDEYRKKDKYEYFTVCQLRNLLKPDTTYCIKVLNPENFYSTMDNSVHVDFSDVDGATFTTAPSKGTLIDYYNACVNEGAFYRIRSNGAGSVYLPYIFCPFNTGFTRADNVYTSSGYGPPDYHFPYRKFCYTVKSGVKNLNVIFGGEELYSASIEVFTPDGKHICGSSISEDWDGYDYKHRHTWSLFGIYDSSSMKIEYYDAFDYVQQPIDLFPLRDIKAFFLQNSDCFIQSAKYEDGYLNEAKFTHRAKAKYNAYYQTDENKYNISFKYNDMKFSTSGISVASGDAKYPIAYVNIDEVKEDLVFVFLSTSLISSKTLPLSPSGLFASYNSENPKEYNTLLHLAVSYT